MYSQLADAPSKSSKRRPRFVRRNPPPLRVTDDDLAIIRHVAEHRFLRSTHLVRLLNRSPDKVLRRLAALYHNGYLDRPRSQRDHYPRAGSASLVYALGNRGAWHCAMNGADLAAASDWTDKNRSAGRPYIEHALLVADLMVAIEIAARENPTIKFVPAGTIHADMPEELRHTHSSWTLTASLPYSNVELSVTPDKVFALDFLNLGRRNYFFVEADRGKMPIERASLAQSSFKKKVLRELYT